MNTSSQFETTIHQYETDPSEVLQKQLSLIDVNLENVKANPNDGMIYLAHMMEVAFQELIDTSNRESLQLKEVRIHWLNIFDAERNPDSLKGFFRVIGRATKNIQ
jgi:hypothetical protein